MSVPMSQRGESKLEIIRRSIDVVEKLDNIYGNEKYIPKRKRNYGLVAEIMKEAFEMNTLFCKANGIPITANEDDFRLRHQLQSEGLGTLRALEPMLNLLWKKYSIPTGLMSEIMDDIDYIEKRFRNWQFSDKNRHEDAIKNAEKKKAEKEAEKKEKTEAEAVKTASEDDDGWD